MRKENAQKIAVLGGGISSISSVWKLTNEKDWQDKYDITVYQMGWRLGGKGASGRNPDRANRIEEHGLHLWFGCYHNSFNFMESCYNELNRKIGETVYSLEEAFEPSRYVTLHEEINGEPTKWHMDFHFNDKKLGTLKPLPSVWENLVRMMKIMIQQSLEGNIAFTFDKSGTAGEEERAFYRNLNKDFMKHFKKYMKVMGLQINELTPDEMIEVMEEFMYNQKVNEKFDLLLYMIDEIRTWLWAKIENKIYEYHDLRRMWMLFDLTMATIVGTIKDDLHNKGLDVINHMDFRDWISQYSVTPEITAWSSPIQAMYSLIFCGKEMHTFEAGTCLRCIFRVTLDYNDAFYYRMQGGMGDIVFGPAYQVLKRRGVKFKFFHKVENLGLNDSKDEIETISMGRQVTLKNEEYNPFIKVGGLDCWPSRPNYEQFVEGDELKAIKIDLEEQFNDWDYREVINLKKGEDFDKVICGISLGALPYVAPELIAANDNWKKMVEKVVTTPTQALQIWLKPDIRGLGWQYGKFGKPLVGNFAGEFDTWADLSNIIRRESWDKDNQPENLAYLCGKLDTVALTPSSDKDHHKQQLKRVENTIHTFLDEHSKLLWPKAHKDGKGFNMSTLVKAGAGANGLQSDSIYYRANLEPTEQYVLADKGTSKYRLSAGKTGFKNLVITGDWIDNGWNAGCIEATMLSGLQAARAISGENFSIIGEVDPTALTQDQIESYKTTRRVVTSSEMLLKIKKLFTSSPTLFIRNQ